MERTSVNMLLPDLDRSCDVLEGRKGVLPFLAKYSHLAT